MEGYCSIKVKIVATLASTLLILILIYVRRAVPMIGWSRRNARPRTLKETTGNMCHTDNASYFRGCVQKLVLFVFLVLSPACQSHLRTARGTVAAHRCRRYHVVRSIACYHARPTTAITLGQQLLSRSINNCYRPRPRVAQIGGGGDDERRERRRRRHPGEKCGNIYIYIYICMHVDF